MANNLNRATIAGRLTRQPELITTKNGKHATTVSIASNYYGGADKPDSVSFFTVKAFGGTAEFICRCFNKGDELVVDGQLREDRWEKDGQKRSLIYILADSVYFGAKKKGSEPAPEEAVEAEDISDEDCALIDGEAGDLPF